MAAIKSKSLSFDVAQAIATALVAGCATGLPAKVEPGAALKTLLMRVIDSLRSSFRDLPAWG